ncbi:hypothetical protein O181_031039 [Austropuccinia psidii MF-1]|uniref:Uncharacterized protein n=1 Tax=Austropuccinia psidii MF-1 TaxID=1389203 RepID=A0A9Q3CU24_9BASI|nr:hypothetical protein [Austropuccinia psidii MF-1]
MTQFPYPVPFGIPDFLAENLSSRSLVPMDLPAGKTGKTGIGRHPDYLLLHVVLTNLEIILAIGNMTGKNHDRTKAKAKQNLMLSGRSLPRLTQAPCYVFIRMRLFFFLLFSSLEVFARANVIKGFAYARRSATFGSCPAPVISFVYDTGIVKFASAQSQFQAPATRTIKETADFICLKLESTCKVSKDVLSRCQEASRAAQNQTGEQKQVDKFNNLMRIEAVSTGNIIKGRTIAQSVTNNLTQANKKETSATPTADGKHDFRKPQITKRRIKETSDTNQNLQEVVSNNTNSTGDASSNATLTGDNGLNGESQASNRSATLDDAPSTDEKEDNFLSHVQEINKEISPGLGGFNVDLFSGIGGTNDQNLTKNDETNGTPAPEKGIIKSIFSNEFDVGGVPNPTGTGKLNDNLLSGFGEGDNQHPTRFDEKDVTQLATQPSGILSLLAGFDGSQKPSSSEKVG